MCARSREYLFAQRMQEMYEGVKMAKKRNPKIPIAVATERRIQLYSVTELVSACLEERLAVDQIRCSKVV